jgi:hypothetical protein
MRLVVIKILDKRVPFFTLKIDYLRVKDPVLNGVLWVQAAGIVKIGFKQQTILRVPYLTIVSGTV